ncbi:MAG: hypothetical protein ABS84_10650 [Rubrivivax sp. SCN 71-131]|jgi:hypothetical protein|nr:MAG: hypothetical protein ABS84_10650 [Rubrivivax sp. SCN 71-131]
MTAASTLHFVALLGLACSTAAVHAQATQSSKAIAKRSLRPAAFSAPAALVLPPASIEQLAAAARAYFGSYACEFNQSVSVATNGRHEGYVDVAFGKSLWTMKPVLSSTGALRLEDVKGRMLLLQIATKSMLMDTVAGRRTIDNCVHEKQRNVAQPAPGQSLGIDPALAAAAAAANAAAAPEAAASAAVPVPAAATATAMAANPEPPPAAATPQATP